MTCLQRYSEWVQKYTQLARGIENLIYMAPQVLPAKLGDSSIITEFSYSTVGLLKLYHDFVLSVKDKVTRKQNYYGKDEMFHKKLRLCLSILAQTEVSIETVAEYQWGKCRKWDIIAFIEVIKCICRLILLQSNKEGILYRGGQYTSSNVRASNHSLHYRGKRSGKSFTTLDNSRHLKASDHDGIMKDEKIITFGPPLYSTGSENQLQKAGELFHIVRPVFYTLMRRRVKEESWIPFLLSLLLEITGITCSYLSIRKGHSIQHHAKSELSRRKFSLFFYLLRDPFFSKYVVNWINNIIQRTQDIPVAGKLIYFIIHNLVYYYQRHYFYIAASN